MRSVTSFLNLLLLLCHSLLPLISLATPRCSFHSFFFSLFPQLSNQFKTVETNLSWFTSSNQVRLKLSVLYAGVSVPFIFPPLSDLPHYLLLYLVVCSQTCDDHPLSTCLTTCYALMAAHILQLCVY